MADEHSKPELRLGEGEDGESFPERRMKVVTGRYDYPPRKSGPYTHFGRTIRVPQLRLQGRWLEQAGFTLNTPVRVTVSKGRLVVEVQSSAG